MPKIDKESLYNRLAEWESTLFEKFNALPNDTDGAIITERLLLMCQLSTVSLCKFIVHDFPELPEEGGPHEQS